MNENVQQRVQEAFGFSEGDLADYLKGGGRPNAAVVDSAMDDAQQAAIMLGCALMGSDEYYGGTPAHEVVCHWTHLVERRMQIARALAAAALEPELEGNSDE